VAALDRFAAELLERAGRREAVQTLPLGDTAEVTLGLAGQEQAIHTPPIALATMLHRDVVLLHGHDDAWASPDEAHLMVEALRDGGNEPVLHLTPGGHDLRDADPEVLAAFVDDLVERMRPRELPPVLVAIEQMSTTDR